MTTIAMAAGMFPSALGLGDGGGFRSPMAIAVMGGLGGLDPAVAGLRAGGLHADRRYRRADWRIFGRFVGETDEAAHPRPAAAAADEEIDLSALPMPGPAE